MKNKSVLIAEDESIIALDLKRILTSAGYSIDTIVRDGEDLVSKALADNPDLIIMDVFLKGKVNGLNAATNIRLNSNVPILFISGSNKKAIKGMVDFSNYEFIAKPYEEAALLSTVNKLLNI